MIQLGKVFVLFGLLMAIAGLIMYALGRYGGLAMLPGDLHFTAGRGHVWIPITTALVLSVLATMFLWASRRFL